MTPFVCLVNNLQPVIPIDILQLFKIGRREACSFLPRLNHIIYGFCVFSMQPISSKFITNSTLNPPALLTARAFRSDSTAHVHKASENPSAQHQCKRVPI